MLKPVQDTPPSLICAGGRADYGGRTHVKIEEATEAVRTARKILNEIRQASPESLPELPAEREREIS